MHDICPFAKNPCRENRYSAKREQFMCAKNPCFTVCFPYREPNRVPFLLQHQQLHIYLRAVTSCMTRPTLEATPTTYTTCGDVTRGVEAAILSTCPEEGEVESGSGSGSCLLQHGMLCDVIRLPETADGLMAVFEGLTAGGASTSFRTK